MRRTNLAYGNKTSASYSYDPASGLTSIAQTFVSPSPGVTFGYGRDALERTAGESVSQSGYLWYPPGAGSTLYTPNNLNQYTAINGNSLSYDGNGNLKSDPTAPLGASSYVWDLKNRLTPSTNTQHRTTYTYDAFSRRSSKVVDGVTTVFVWDGNNLIATYNGSGTEFSHFYYGADAAPVSAETMGANNSFTAVAYHHTDALGSVRATSDYDGHILESFGFAPDGQASAIPTSTPFGFAGMLLDAETHLYYDHARYYSPSQGRFLSPDPIGSKGGVNIYEYAKGDPLDNADTTGLFSDGQGAYLVSQGACFCGDYFVHFGPSDGTNIAGEGQPGPTEVDDANGNFVSYVGYGANGSTYFTDEAGDTQNFTSGPNNSVNITSSYNNAVAGFAASQGTEGLLIETGYYQDKLTDAGAAAGAATGAVLAGGASVGVDAITGGANIVATPAEIGAGASGGAIIGGGFGYVIGGGLDAIGSIVSSESDDESAAPSAGSLKNVSQADLQAAAEADGYDTIEDWKQQELGLNSKVNIAKDSGGNLYSVPRIPGSGPPQSLGIRLPNR